MRSMCQNEKRIEISKITTLLNSERSEDNCRRTALAATDNTTANIETLITHFTECPCLCVSMRKRAAVACTTSPIAEMRPALHGTCISSGLNRARKDPLSPAFWILLVLFLNDLGLPSSVIN
ncbi:uncharacterized protein ASCRUDRAFT_113725 [Ascoidea rubescens DSM 1968]|uniref:Uncharacterized protein n=1 Tax=Ascoidea rubescens DSM 1968 TaxID=1344418 RepID=A0A1D2VC69_9ASCO|nr:hypothetical protein ASCRUDRAFT_113725 [Ascoidea rubescens DSM 1968]ODV59209.1 hypothetical protein ASCRUDRAFT_113725 [Ascoidea rubescens DSM 1968]